MAYRSCLSFTGDKDKQTNTTGTSSSSSCSYSDNSGRIRKLRQDSFTGSNSLRLDTHKRASDGEDPWNKSSYAGMDPMKTEPLEKGHPKDCFLRLTTLDDTRLIENLSSATGRDHLDLSDKIPSGDSSRPFDNQHVFLPFYLKKGSDERWKKIQDSLSNCKEGRVMSGNELKELILKYNESSRSRWDFDGLVLFFKDMEGKEKWSQIMTLLPKMADLALQIDKLVINPIPFLKRGKTRSISLTKKQIACLLANAFFCTYPMRNSDPQKEKYSLSPDRLSLPSINFSSLFKYQSIHLLTRNKLECIFNYFDRATSGFFDADMKVIFKRQVLPKQNPVLWNNSSKRFSKLHVSSHGRIEDEAGLLQVDFANKFVGGGVIGRGCVQEEILFLVSPELIISRLFTEVLDADEVLIITGSEIYSKYKGYAANFEWDGNYIDQTQSKNGVKLTHLVAMDAKKFYRDEEQFEMDDIKRELNKAYCGFFCENVKKDDRLPGIATGNWGCGAFGGDRHLKSLIQMMAAAEAGRDICYFTHGDTDLVRKMSDVYDLITGHNLTVGDVYNIIRNYVDRVKSDFGFRRSKQLFDYITSTFVPVEDKHRAVQSQETSV